MSGITVNGNNQTIIGSSSPDTITVNGNKDNVYGDFITQVFSYGPTVGTANLNFAGGGNTLNVSGNNAALYGSGGDVSLSLTGSDNNSVALGGASILDLTYNAGANTLLASGNNDVLYGAIRDLTITLTGGSNNTAADAGMAVLDTYTIALGSNTIGNASAPINGNNEVVYGALRDYTFTFSPGDANSGTLAGATTTDLLTSAHSSFSAGANHITLGNGNNDIVFGAMENYSLICNPSDNNSGSGQNASYAGPDYGFRPDTVVVGGNVITVGDGNNDIVYGALESFSIQAAAGDFNTGTAPGGGDNEVGDETTHYTFGGNAITLGNGNNDIVYGAMSDLTITAIAGNNNKNFQNGNVTILLTGAGDIFDASGNTITLGSGNNDVVYGAMRDLTLTDIGGNDNTSNGSNNENGATIVHFVVVAGHNILTVGSGNNDVVYGSTQDMLFSLTGGDNNAGVNGGIRAGNSNFSSSTISVGGNMLTLGNGNNDVAFGDMNSLSISLAGGLSNSGVVASTGGANYFFNTISLGGDNIQVGNGNNDVVFASMDSLNISETQGSNLGSGVAAFTNYGGVGNNAITFANTTVTIGNGKNDTVVADDVLNLTGLNLFLDTVTTPGTANKVTWGNNTIAGGTGNDNYVFSLADDVNGNMAMQGVDILTNFNPAKKDMLSFGYVNDANNDGKITAADLDTTSAFVNIHQGGVSGAILGVAAIFNQLGNAAVTDFQNAINSFTASDANTGLTLLQDVANYITDGGLAAAVGALEAPHGGLILEGQTTSTMGSFSQINALHALTVEHTAVAVHA